ncbi:MAG: CPBP family intramembrane glutamic endopeptidase [Paracoccaceae bacterium]
MAHAVARPDDVRTVGLISYLLFAFGMAWGLIALWLWIPETLTRVVGPLSGHNPLFILAVYAPAISAILHVLMNGGVSGLGRFLGRLGRWRCNPAWYAVLLLGIPAIYYAGAFVKGGAGAFGMPFDSIGAAFSAFALAAVIGPVEEFGWRGMALPVLQRLMAPIWAGLVLGAIWGLWHLPAFWIAGTPQSAWDFSPFLLGSVAVSVVVTPMFNDSRGSILLPALFHWQLNNPIFPDAQPYDTPLFVVLAVAVVWLNRDKMFRRDGAVTRVIPERG